jgi:hypothetical protein
MIQPCPLLTLAFGPLATNRPGKCARIQRGSKVSVYVPDGFSIPGGLRRLLVSTVLTQLPVSSAGGAGGVCTVATTVSDVRAPFVSTARTVKRCVPR